MWPLVMRFDYCHFKHWSLDSCNPIEEVNKFPKVPCLAPVFVETPRIASRCGSFVLFSNLSGDRHLLTFCLGPNQECLVQVGSPYHLELVPALCTHRPSLLPMNFFARVRDLKIIAELTRPTGFKGKRSRNKAAVGEPTAGSLPIFDLMLDPSIIY